jgi:hypothetical protein
MKATVKVRDIHGHPRESQTTEQGRQRGPFDSLHFAI